MGRRRVTEFGTTGVDEALQGLTSSPYPPVGNPSYGGLRIPQPRFGAANRYLFCLATFNTNGGRIRGLRQGLKIGLDTDAGTSVVERPVEMWVRTPDFRFQDGNVSWHLVKESAQRLKVQIAPTDTQSWSRLQSQGPALLYDTFTNTNVTPTGAPVIYSLNLTAYTPPRVATSWQPIGGLGTWYDLRFPWDSEHAWNSVDIPIDKGWYSLYASVLQTNPATRVAAIYTATATPPAGNSNLSFGQSIPEEAFLAAFPPVEGGIAGVSYWRIYGAIIVEDQGR